MEGSRHLEHPEAFPLAPDLGDLEAQELALLREIRDGVAGGQTQLAVSDGSVPPGLSPDFPFPGSQRWLVPREAVGGLLLVEGFARLLVGNPNRIGGQIVNAGETGLLVVLADSAGPASASIYLAPEGGAWDLRLSNVVWCGSVYAQIQGEGSAGLASVAEV